MSDENQIKAGDVVRLISDFKYNMVVLQEFPHDMVDIFWIGDNGAPYRERISKLVLEKSRTEMRQFKISGIVQE